MFIKILNFVTNDELIFTYMDFLIPYYGSYFNLNNIKYKFVAALQILLFVTVNQRKSTPLKVKISSFY